MCALVDTSIFLYPSVLAQSDRNGVSFTAQRKRIRKELVMECSQESVGDGALSCTGHDHKPAYGCTRASLHELDEGKPFDYENIYSKTSCASARARCVHRISCTMKCVCAIVASRMCKTRAYTHTRHMNAHTHWGARACAYRKTNTHTRKHADKRLQTDMHADALPQTYRRKRPLPSHRPRTISQHSVGCVVPHGIFVFGLSVSTSEREATSL